MYGLSTCMQENGKDVRLGIGGCWGEGCMQGWPRLPMSHVLLCGGGGLTKQGRSPLLLLLRGGGVEGSVLRPTAVLPLRVGQVTKPGYLAPASVGLMG